MPVSDFDREVYQALAAYAFDEAIVWPAQTTIARDLKVSRWRVMRAIHRLICAGWVTLLEQRWSPRTRRLHNVYELLHAWAPVPKTERTRIVRRGFVRDFRRCFGEHYRRLHTNPKGCDVWHPAVRRTVVPMRGSP